MIAEDKKQIMLNFIQFGGDSAEADKICDEIDANGLNAEFTAWLDSLNGMDVYPEVK